jgi:undecaprenyl-diphosphatase
MACGLLFSLIWRKKITTTLLMLWVAANCYSRMYLGVHYPLDIIGGIAVGALMGWAGYVVLSALNVVQSNYTGAGECEVRHSTAD